MPTPRPVVTLCSAALALLLVGCSVSTPRGGASALGTSAEQDEGQPQGAGPVEPSAGVAGSLGPSGVVSSTGGVAFAAPGAQSSEAPAAQGPTVGKGAAPRQQGQGSRGSTVGITATSVTISVLAGYSGTYGPIFTKIVDNGLGTWVDDVNANGGIGGRKVRLKKVDNKDTAEGGIAACKEVKGNGSFFAISVAGLGGADAASAGCLDAAGITTLATELSAFDPHWNHVFSATGGPRQTVPLASFMKNVIADRAGKIGILYVKDGVFIPATRALAQEVKRIGLSLVGQEAVSPNQGSFVAELSRLRDRGATTVAIIAGVEGIGVLRDAKAIGYAPNFTGTLGFPDDGFTSASPELYAGVRAIRDYASTNSPAYKPFAAKAKKYGHDDLVNATVMALYGVGLLTERVLVNAGPHPGRGDLTGAIESIQNYNNQILALSFGPGRHEATVRMWPLKCCNGDRTWQGSGAPQAFFS